MELTDKANGAFLSSATGTIFRGLTFSGFHKTYINIAGRRLREESQMCGSALRSTSSSCSYQAMVIQVFLHWLDHCHYRSRKVDKKVDKDTGIEKN